MEQSKPIYKVRNIDNLRDLLNQSAKLFADRPAFKIRNQENEDYDIITYAKLKHLVDCLGTKLVNMGLKGKKIAVISENRYEWCISYLAVVNGTGIVVPLDRALPAEEIENLLIRSEVEAVIFSKKYIDTMKKVKAMETKIKNFILMDQQEEEEFLEFDELLRDGKRLIENGNQEFLNSAIDNKAMNILLFTSGTTAASKAVMLSHRNICSNIMATCQTVEIKPTDVLLSFLPLHHTYECTIGFLIPIYCGASIVHCEGLRYIMKNLKESQATVMVCVPLLFENMHKKILEQAEKSGITKKLRTGVKISNFLRKYLGLDLTRKLFKPVYEGFGGKMRLFICGAASLNPQVAKDFNDFGIKLLQGYGLTETSPLLAGGTDRHVRYNATGRPLPGVQVQINEPNEEGIGEIIAKGPNVMLGYYQNEEATKDVLKDGWFYTGDLGYIDRDGSIVITGRKKSVIVLKNGKNIFPEELESLLNQDEYIKESFVWGKPSKDGDTIISAKIIPNLDTIKEKLGSLTDIQVTEVIRNSIKAINQKIPTYKAIRNWMVSAEELIKTTTQKTKRYEEIKKVEEQETKPQVEEVEKEIEEESKKNP